MKILHVSTESYPAAKAGGLGDVVGALPKYLNNAGLESAVIIPKYKSKWIESRSFSQVNQGLAPIHKYKVPYAIEQYDGDDLGYPLFVVNIPGFYDRTGVYNDPATGQGYSDELERAILFQEAVLQWVMTFKEKPDVIHCHDHFTGLIPFFVKYAYDYQSLKDIPTVFTIHNGNYSGSFSWKNAYLLPNFDDWKGGLLDWNGLINPLASAVRCCWRLTTVSPGYFQELQQSSNGLEALLQQEAHKSIGILNGIDTKVWDPGSDSLIYYPYEGNLETFKGLNKKVLCERFQLDPAKPLVTFIGRLVGEKGADLLPSLIGRYIAKGGNASFIVLGTGDYWLHGALDNMRNMLRGSFNVSLEYNESLAHQLYAGADFLIMPSRVEPCGLNQMYALRYGTVPIVRSVGGLKDTIIDIGDKNGRGIRFNNFTVEDGEHALFRAEELYRDQETFKALRARNLEVDFSWEKSASEYIRLYSEVVL